MVTCPKNVLNNEKLIASVREKEITVCEAPGYGIAGSQDYSFKVYWQKE